ncbi:hypothetical protein M7775_13375 [Sporomusa sphaeroides DSM 2875]|nr:hypothetical protein [Sporomusa sphaeroides]MCM0759543.1 hypothetical protein [Sporomusa sphaeroides DSM 2875]
MEQNKPELPEAGNTETYTPGQKIVLKVLKWGAWTVSAVAMVYVMHY